MGRRLGCGLGMIERATESISIDVLVPLIREQLSAGQSVRFSPRGVSMLPLLRQGIDSVVLSPVPDQLCKYDIVFYQRDNGKYVLHRIIAVGDTYTCMGDNQVVPEQGLRIDQMIAVVTAFHRRDKAISVDNPVYWWYCRAWIAMLPFRKLIRRVKNKLSRIWYQIKK